jgi:hypothetical protein
MITYGSAGINDQLIPVFDGSAIWGLNLVGPVFHGNGQRPPQSIPTGITSPTMAASGTPQTAFLNTTQTGNGSMLLIIVAGLAIVGYLGMRYIHWR